MLKKFVGLALTFSLRLAHMAGNIIAMGNQLLVAFRDTIYRESISKLFSLPNYQATVWMTKVVSR